MKKNIINIYLHLGIAILLISLIQTDLLNVNLLIAAYVVWLVMKKDAVYLPALIALCPFSSSLYVYYSIILLSIINFNTLKHYRVHVFLLVLLAFLPIILYAMLQKSYLLGLPLGASMASFSSYLTIFTFFYGVLISKSFDRDVFMAIVIEFFIYYVLFFTDVIPETEAFPRIIYLGIVFFFTVGFYYFLSNYKKFSIFILLLSLLTIILFISKADEDSTFTVVSSIALAFFYLILYLRKKLNLLQKSTGSVLIFFSIFLIIFGSWGYKSGISYLGFSDKESTFKNATNFEGRFMFKFLDDRGKLWNNEIELISSGANMLPRIEIDLLSKAYDKTHNTLMFSLFSYGLIIGSIIILYFIQIILFGRKYLGLIKKKDALFDLLIISTLSLNISGAISGSFPLSLSYAIIGITVLGISYGKYFEIICD